MAINCFCSISRRLLINSICKFHSQRRSVSYLLSKLSNRKLIRVCGSHSYDYVQGMITNDVRHLKNTLETSVNLDAIFAFMLNHLGRVICDVFVYKGKNENDNELVLEVDSSLVDGVYNHFKAYRVKRKVKIEQIENLNPWALYPQNLDDFSIYETSVKSINVSLNDESIIMRDPRLRQLGFRILSPTSYENQDKMIELLQSNNYHVTESTLDNYNLHRYKLGVGEGANDHPIEACFPLECNADYIHGVSFHKGCYVGQELTARVYHTGVIRKRLMPIQILCDQDKIDELNLSIKTSIVNSEGKNIGKFRSNLRNYGLALLRVDDVFKSNKLILNETDIEIKAWKPDWWPKEVSKDALPTGKATYLLKNKETIQVQRSRLLYQSHKRGIKENCLLLGSFADKYLNHMTQEQLDMYDYIINTPSDDWDLYKWMTGTQQVPNQFKNSIMDMLIEHCKNLDKEIRFN